jgi:hypothetical protein
MSSDQKDISVLRQQFLNQPPDTHTKHWDDLWQKNTTPWDRNGPSLALKDAVTGRQDLFDTPLKDGQQRKRALVPGCEHSSIVKLLVSNAFRRERL